jgi:hypothetical protein
VEALHRFALLQITPSKSRRRGRRPSSREEKRNDLTTVIERGIIYILCFRLLVLIESRKNVKSILIPSFASFLATCIEGEMDPLLEIARGDDD